MSKTQSKILLLLVFMSRGSSFIFSKSLMNDLDPISILAIRFLLTFILMFILNIKKLKFNKESIKGGITIGIIYTIMMILEMYGLRLIDSGVSSLIENMAIIYVPIFISLYTRKLPSKKIIICAIICLIGLSFLTLSQTSKDSAILGIILTIIAAIAYAISIIYTSYSIKEGDPLTIGVIQMGIIGIISLIISLFNSGLTVPSTNEQWLMLLMLVIVCSCFGFVYQPIAQKNLSANTAAVFTIVNPLTASLLGIIVANETLTIHKIIGIILIFIGLIYYNINLNEKG